ncbi:MAG: gamma-glutamylcyclotransferase [Rhizobiaceae bacterium]|nr:gamma-glutamylcyclotransferase [Rhizobiaceae bacterium]
MNDQSSELVGYFGFGSLVNKDTLRTSYVDVVPARLKGWRRHWQARTETLPQKVALLSIHKEPACDILGLMVVDRLENLPLVDEREEGYSRVKLTPANLVLPDTFSPPQTLYVYVADEVPEVVDDGCLLQSYLDAVMQGFHREHGKEGVQHFVDTTTKFDRPLICDRDNPLYPRSVTLDDGEADLFDRTLKSAGVRF